MVPISPFLRQNLPLKTKVIVVLVSMKWYLIVVLICISLMANDVGLSFHLLSQVYIFFEEMSIQILYPFFLILYLFYLFIYL